MKSELARQEAMVHAWDVMEAAQIPFVVLGEAAFQIYYEGHLSVDKIVFGVLKQHAMPECVGLLSAIDEKVEMLSDGWKIQCNEIPVYVKVLTNGYKRANYDTIKNPDVVWYHVEPFRIPNPFALYWSGDHFDI